MTTLAFAISSCGGKKEATDDAHQHEHEHAAPAAEAVAESSVPQFTVDAAFQQQLAAVFKSYVALKEAFVASDAKKVSTEAATTTASLASVDMKLVTGAAHHDWTTFHAGMESALKEMTTATDIEVQRTAFSKLSEQLYKSIKAYGLGGATTAFYEFCPMAFDNQGGFWLSDSEQIRNPYFGDQMLTCGSVKEKLQ